MILATIDLGSNSFHMLIVEAHHGKITKHLAREKEKVQLRAGLQPDGSLDAKARQRALNCFQKFATTLKQFNPDHVKVVGTYTLRSAHNIDTFLATAEQTLGYPIEIVSGLEEARLIYVGITSAYTSTKPCLTIDIGGGSTEIVIGLKDDILVSHSLNMGCVSIQQAHFGDGHMTSTQFESAFATANALITPVLEQYTNQGWVNCIGSSGTIGAISSIFKAQYQDATLTLDRLQTLQHTLTTIHTLRDLHLPGLRPDRENILPGGLAILMALFQALQIKSMSVSKAAIREGVMIELLQATAP